MYLSPDLESSVPRACAQSLAILGNAQAGDTVLVTGELLDELASESVPDVAVVVIITSEQKTAGVREGNRGDTAEDTLVTVLIKLAVGTDIEETARRVVGTSTEGVAVGEESN